MRLSASSALMICNFHVDYWENANIKDLSAWVILMIFLCIYLGEGRRGGGVALMHVYIWEYTHSQPLLHVQNRLMDVYEIW